MTDWKPTEAEPYMKVGPLRALLASLPDDLLIVLSKDGEGNDFSPLSDTGDPARDVYEPETTWHGDVISNDEVDTEGAVPCLVLWPVN